MRARSALAPRPGCLGAPRIVRAEGKITVLNWQGYGTDEAWAVEAFKKATGIEVVHDYFNSEPEMITKLRTNPGAYDVVLTNSAWNGVASGEGLVQAIDTAQIKPFRRPQSVAARFRAAGQGRQGLLALPGSGA